uniref:Secreted protein n=1 Tax=Strongyloides venezuelensis TaxID=75913 RepID=A0A0K0FWX7_STRVS
MVCFGNLLTFGIISLSNIVVTSFPFTTYETAVRGIPRCTFCTRSLISVFITEKSSFTRRRSPIAGTMTKFGVPFYIFGGTRRLTKPHLYLSIAHKCSSYGRSCDQFFEIRIPPQYIVKRKQRLNVYVLRELDLSNLPLCRKKCGRKRREDLLPLLDLPETHL